MIQLLLFLHVGAAIVAFGPTFMLSMVGAMSRAEPMHANFSLRLGDRITYRRIYPFALSMPVTGVLLIWATGIDVLAPRSLWLLAAIVLYVVALGYSYLVQTPTIRRMIELTSRPPGPPGEGAIVGPPPELLALGAKAAQGGMLLVALVTVILGLMIFKPGS